MKMSRISSAVAALALTLGAAGAANALTITSGDYTFTIKAYDSGTTGYTTSCTTVASCDLAATTPAPGSAAPSINRSADTMGIFSISQIFNDTTATTVFRAGTTDGYLTGIFGNLTDYNVALTLTNTIAKAQGGTFIVYQNAADMNPTFGATPSATLDFNNNLYPGITNGNIYLKGVFTSGAVAGDTKTTYQSSFLSNTFAGTGTGFIDLTGGSAYSTFHTQALTDLNSHARDLSINTTFGDTNGAASRFGFTVVSAGTLQGTADTTVKP